MEKFNRTLRGYDPIEVNQFLDQIIKQVETMVQDNKIKDTKIKELEEKLNSVKNLEDQVEQYERMEGTLNRAILMAQKTSDQMRSTTEQESRMLIEDAKKNANRIINEALMKAEKIENDAIRLKRNVNIFKRRLKDIVQAQVEVIDEIETIDL